MRVGAQTWLGAPAVLSLPPTPVNLLSIPVGTQTGPPWDRAPFILGPAADYSSHPPG